MKATELITILVGRWAPSSWKKSLRMTDMTGCQMANKLLRSNLHTKSYNSMIPLGFERCLCFPSSKFLKGTNIFSMGGVCLQRNKRFIFVCKLHIQRSLKVVHLKNPLTFILEEWCFELLGLTDYTPAERTWCKLGLWRESALSNQHVLDMHTSSCWKRSWYVTICHMLSVTCCQCWLSTSMDEVIT